jgi:predicted Fe-S protein YdhL (DUF1289 family)
MARSPCVGVCDVEDGVCTACDRTLEDIARWSSMSERERLERMRELAATDGEEP